MVWYRCAEFASGLHQDLRSCGAVPAVVSVHVVEIESGRDDAAGRPVCGG